LVPRYLHHGTQRGAQSMGPIFTWRDLNIERREIQWTPLPPRNGIIAILENNFRLCTSVIPANAGIQGGTGSRRTPGRRECAIRKELYINAIFTQKSDSFKPYSGTALPERLRLTGRRAVGYAHEAEKGPFQRREENVALAESFNPMPAKDQQRLREAVAPFARSL
jgi:hypothetical protein